MLLTEVLVAIAVVAQAKHRHHEKKRDQARRREDDSTVTALQFSCPQPNTPPSVSCHYRGLGNCFYCAALEEYFTSLAKFHTSFIQAISKGSTF